MPERSATHSVPARSLARVHAAGEFLVFARANPAHSGRRHVQVTRSRSDPFEAPASPSSGVSERWAPFEMLQIDGYDGSGDVYFFGAQVNPSHNGSLLAVFPLVHRLRACLGIAASVDSVRWSRVTPLLSCQLYGERTMDQPAVPSGAARAAHGPQRTAPSAIRPRCTRAPRCALCRCRRWCGAAA